jgi:hypothetical protein
MADLLPVFGYGAPGHLPRRRGARRAAIAVDRSPGAIDRGARRERADSAFALPIRRASTAPRSESTDATGIR